MSILDAPDLNTPPLLALGWALLVSAAVALTYWLLLVLLLALFAGMQALVERYGGYTAVTSCAVAKCERVALWHGHGVRRFDERRKRGAVCSQHGGPA